METEIRNVADAPTTPPAMIPLSHLLGWEDVGLVLAPVVAWGVVAASDHVAAGALSGAAADVLGSFPDDLGEVAGSTGEATAGIVVSVGRRSGQHKSLDPGGRCPQPDGEDGPRRVLRGGGENLRCILAVPSVDGLGEATVSHSKVLSVLSLAVLKDASLAPRGGIVLEGLAFCERRDAVLGAEDIVGSNVIITSAAGSGSLWLWAWGGCLRFWAGSRCLWLGCRSGIFWLWTGSGCFWLWRWGWSWLDRCWSGCLWRRGRSSHSCPAGTGSVTA